MTEDQLRSAAGQVRLLCLDVDGVMTDGAMYYSPAGEAMKRFHTQDAAGIALARKAGVEIAWISADDSPITAARARKLEIVHFAFGCDDKVRAAEVLRCNCTASGESSPTWATIGSTFRSCSASGCRRAPPTPIPRCARWRATAAARAAAMARCGSCATSSWGRDRTAADRPSAVFQEHTPGVETMAEVEQYIQREGLDRLLDFGADADYQEGVFDAVSGNLTVPFPPQAADLVRLHRTIRQRKSFTVLEFGVGYSTIVIADALRKNQQDWERLARKPEVRNRFMFQVFSVQPVAGMAGASQGPPAGGPGRPRTLVFQ